MKYGFAFPRIRVRDCAEIAKRSCRREELTMPPMRGG